MPNKSTSTSIPKREKVAEVMRIGGARKGDASIELKRRTKKNRQKPKLNVTLPEDTKQKLAALAQLEKRSVSNLIEVMGDERWKALAEREGIDYAKTVAEIAGLKDCGRTKKLIAKNSDARSSSAF